VLIGIEKELKESLTIIATKSNFEIVEMETDKDHTNFLQRNEDKAYYDIQTSILDENPKVNMNGVVYPFMYLYLSGYRSSLRINHSEWKEEVSWKEAADRAIDFIGRGRNFDEETKERITNYYQTASQDGMYSFESDAYTSMMIREV
jgi:REP element-mobilizing transposase RayT